MDLAERVVMLGEAMRRQMPKTVRHLSPTELDAIIAIVIMTLELERAQENTKS